MQSVNNMEKNIRQKITSELMPTHLELEDESASHSGHQMFQNPASHFRAVIVSDRFKDKSLVERHRMVYDLLKEELKGAIHALALKTFTPEEWGKK